MPSSVPWFLYAIAAAILWGLNYALTEKLMKTFSTAIVLLSAALGGLVMAILMGLSGGGFRRDLELLQAGGREVWWLVASVVVYVVANLCILASVRGSNATIAAVVETTYPLFTVVFAWLLFREMQATSGTLLGAVLIIAGVACVLVGGK